MTRPEIIRADSIDLQDQNAPSAKDHSRQPALTSLPGAATRAPHQAETLRELAVEVAEENGRSPRVSREWTNGEVQHLQQYGDDLAAGVTSKLNGTDPQQQDNLAVAQNGGLTGSTSEDADMADAEGDDGMDDDMMDKISSSPSIDDGGYSLPQLWPQRSDSLTRTPIRSTSKSQACGESSSPFVETPTHFPLRLLLERRDEDACQPPKESQEESNRHLPGEYIDFEDDISYYIDEESEPLIQHEENTQPEEETGESSYNFMDYYVDEHLSEYLYLRGKNGKHIVPQDDKSAAITIYTQQQASGSSETPNSPEDPTQLTADFTEDQHTMLGTPYPKEPYPQDQKSSSDEGYDTEDDDYDISQRSDKSRFVDSGWDGDCLQHIEDIDFEFVYALHTFVATVEGQANATKGDTMVLLDDSNSYWWLVRVVKDSSIGYLPAEHIETPTERLARLNKHRNIDLTSTMLGDQAEKSKNPLKKAIRRRNAKTVTFAAPTYVEASDVDYSTEEEDGEADYYGQNGQQDQNGDQQEQSIEEDEITAVEPLKPRAEIREVKSDPTESDATKSISDEARNSDEIFDGSKPESKSRNGTLRNTDSFFKDDTVETRKITLTPNLLRDDSSTSTRTSNDSKDPKRPSLDKLEKDSPEKSKDKKEKKEKKEKEKKPGMLSGLFKRKDKKASNVDKEIDEVVAGKQSSENVRNSPSSSKDSDEIVAIMEDQHSGQQQDMQRHASKLQKQPRTEISPVRKAGQAREPPKTFESQVAATADGAAPVEPQASSMRLVQPEPAQEEIVEPRSLSPENKAPMPVASSKELKAAGPISKILRSASSGNSEPKPVKTKKAKSRVELDDFDSSPEDSPVEEPTRAPNKQARPIPGAFPDSYIGTLSNERSNPTNERLSESPVQVSPVIGSQSYPPALVGDTSSQEEPASPASSPSPELIDAEEAREKKGAGSSTASTSTATWIDAHLRTFFDDDADIKDLLVVVYDKSGVVPAGPDHPITGSLFKEENAKLADITNRLDGMLGDWLARKSRAQR